MCKRSILRAVRHSTMGFALLAVAMAPAATACSSDDSAAADGSAGSGTAGSGTAGSGTAGASAAGSGGGGTGGAGGAAAGSGGAGATAGSGGAAGSGATIQIAGTTEEDVQGASMPVADVTVCALDLPSSCTKTDKGGSYVINAPANAESGVTFQKSGYLGIVRLGANGPLPMSLGATRMIPNAAAEAATKAAGIAWPLGGKGLVAASAIANSGSGFVTMADATISIDPAAPKGPVYTKSDGTPDPTLQKTSADGVAYFATFDAGTKFQVAVAAPGKVCDDVKAGWSRSGGKGAGVIVADSMTFVAIACH